MTSVLDFPARRRRVIPFAAAVLATSLAVPYVASLSTANRQAIFRGGRIRPLAPIGAVERGAEFGWSSRVIPARYRLEIGDSSGVVLAWDTTDSRAALSPNAWQRLRPGVDYWWSVTAVDTAGRRLSVSPRARFSVRAR